MSGRSTCKEIQAIREQGRTDREALDLVGDLNLLKKFGANNDSNNSIVNYLRNSIENTTRININEKCQNSTNVKQSNVINKNDNCMLAMVQNCKNPFTGVTNLACLDQIEKFLLNLGGSNRKIEQSNVNNTRNFCEINSYISALTNQETSLSNIAKLLSLQEAKSLFSSNKADNFNCNDVGVSVTNEQFINVVLNCLNETSVNQNNILNDSSCGAQMTSQLNTNSMLNNCLIDNGILVSNTQRASIVNDSSLENKQTASALDMGSSIMIIIIIVVVVVAVFAFSSMKGSGGEKKSQ